MLNIQEAQANILSPVVVKKATLPRKSKIQSNELEILAVIKETLRVFGNEDKALRWLSDRNSAMENKIPLELLGNKLGRKLVTKRLIQISHGIYI